jgi:FLYWCH zinc finger domain
MPSTIRYGMTKRGQRTVIYLNYEYWRFKDYVNGHMLWRCSMHQRSHCKAMLMTHDNRVIGNKCPKHTHSGNAAINKPARNVEVCGTASFPLINSAEHINKFILMDPRNDKLPMKERSWMTLDQKIGDTLNSKCAKQIENLSPEHVHSTNITTEHILNENVRTPLPTNKIEPSKKCILVDSQSIIPPLIEKKLTNFDQAISDTLNSSLSDDIKAFQYIKAIRTFTNHDAPSSAPITKVANAKILHANQCEACSVKYEFTDNNTDRYPNVTKENKNPIRKEMMKELNLSKVSKKKKKNLSKKTKTMRSKWIRY